MKKRYIIIPKENLERKEMHTLQKALSVQFISSEKLNSKVRSKDILNKDTGLFFKNLGVSVVDIEEEKLTDILNKENNILYAEAEREFYPVSNLDDLNTIKNTLETLKKQINDLEKNLQEKKDSEENTTEEKATSYTPNMQALGLERSIYSGKNINVAILDTGFYAKHPDFVNRTIEGKSFIDGEKWDIDTSGHGTHCTGIATGNISLKSHKRYGIAYESNIFIAKVLSDKAVGLTSTILDGIDWALEKKCQVISLSLGAPVEIGEEPSSIFEYVGKRALNMGSLIIAAAGNHSQRPDYLPKPVSTPANSQSIMAVSALTENLRVTNFSNAGLNAADGGKVDLSAPGTNIHSSYSKNAKTSVLYKKMNGTSMATPHVAGVAALYFEAFPNLSASEIWLKMEKNSQTLDLQRKRDVGSGLIQAI